MLLKASGSLHSILLGSGWCVETLKYFACCRKMDFGKPNTIWYLLFLVQNLRKLLAIGTDCQHNFKIDITYFVTKWLARVSFWGMLISKFCSYGDLKMTLTIMKILSIISMFAHHAKKKSVLTLSKLIYKYASNGTLQFLWLRWK